MACDTRIFLKFYPGTLKTATRWNKGTSIKIEGFIDSPACGVMYLNDVNIRITIDVGGTRVIDNVQKTYMNTRRYSIPANYEYDWVVPSKITVGGIGGVEIDTAGMPIAINVSFAGDTKYNPSSITYQNKIPSNPIIDAVEASPVDVQCQEPCDVIIDITWKNNGDLSGNFTPSIIVGNVRIAPHPTQSLAAGATVKKRFTLTGLTTGTYYVKSDPSGIMVPIRVTRIGEPPIEPPIVPPSNGTGLLLIGIGLFAIAIFLFKQKK